MTSPPWLAMTSRSIRSWIDWSASARSSPRRALVSVDPTQSVDTIVRRSIAATAALLLPLCALGPARHHTSSSGCSWDTSTTSSAGMPARRAASRMASASTASYRQ